MAICINQYCCFIVLAISTATISSAYSQTQSSSDQSTVRFTDVVQFGVPRDNKFVFCDKGECPERTEKHLDVPASIPFVPPIPATKLPIQPKTLAQVKPTEPPATKAEKPKLKNKPGHRKAKRKKQKPVC